MIFIIILIYIIGVFAAIALSTWMLAEADSGENVELVSFISVSSWLFVVVALLVFIMFGIWEFIIKYPFVWFYDKCNERFRK